jgi:plastocyanin
MKKAAVALALLLAAFALAACGSSSKDSSGPAPEAAKTAKEPPSVSEVEIEADPSGKPAFTSDTVSAEAGEVVIAFVNLSPKLHNLLLEDEKGADAGGISEKFSNQTVTLTTELKPGTYTFFSSVSNDRKAGMEGTLTVK